MMNIKKLQLPTMILVTAIVALCSGAPMVRDSLSGAESQVDDFLDFEDTSDFADDFQDTVPEAETDCASEEETPELLQLTQLIVISNVQGRSSQVLFGFFEVNGQEMEGAQLGDTKKTKALTIVDMKDGEINAEENDCDSDCELAREAEPIGENLLGVLSDIFMDIGLCLKSSSNNPTNDCKLSIIDAQTINDVSSPIIPETTTDPRTESDPLASLPIFMNSLELSSGGDTPTKPISFNYMLNNRWGPNVLLDNEEETPEALTPANDIGELEPSPSLVYEVENSDFANAISESVAPDCPDNGVILAISKKPPLLNPLYVIPALFFATFIIQQIVRKTCLVVDVDTDRPKILKVPRMGHCSDVLDSSALTPEMRAKLENQKQQIKKSVITV